MTTQIKLFPLQEIFFSGKWNENIQNAAFSYESEQNFSSWNAL